MKCRECGKLIIKARLEVLPETKVCVNCSKEQKVTEEAIDFVLPIKNNSMSEDDLSILGTKTKTLSGESL